MSNSEQKTKGPRALTSEEVQVMKAHRAEHQKKMEIDSEYRKWWEKQKKDFKKVALINDCIED